MGHSRGGHICFRVAQRRPDLLRKLILAEPGGELDATLDPAYKPGPSPLAARIAASAEVIAKGDIDGGLQIFIDALEGPGAWKRLPATPKQLLRDNATTLIGQMRDQRPPFSKADAEAIKTPTLFIGGANTKGTLPQVLHALAANVKGSRTEMIPNTTHPMFEQAPQRYCEIVLDFLAALEAHRRGRLLLVEPPRAIPIGGGRISLEILDALSQRHRWTVAGDRFERGLESPARVIPTSRAIGGEPFGIAFPQSQLLFGQAHPCAP